MNTQFTQEHIRMANEHMKKCLTSFTIRDSQIKTTNKNHYTYQND